MVKLLWRLREQALAVMARALFIRAGKSQNWRVVPFGNAGSQGVSAQEGAASQPLVSCASLSRLCARELCARVSGRRMGLVLPARRAWAFDGRRRRKPVAAQS